MNKPIEMVLAMNRTLRSLQGHTIQFTKGEPVRVPAHLVKEAMGIGAVPVNESELPSAESVNETPIPTGEERTELLFVVYEDMIARNERGEFGASGAPHVAHVSRLAGFEVKGKERDETWAQYKDSLIEDE